MNDVRRRVIDTVMGRKQEQSSSAVIVTSQMLSAQTEPWAGKGSQPGYGYVEARDIEESCTYVGPETGHDFCSHGADENHAGTFTVGLGMGNPVESPFEEHAVPGLTPEIGHATFDPVPERDACEICHGAEGGVPGNENIIDGKVVCDYCDVKHYKFRAAKFSVPDLKLILKLVNEKIAQVKKSEVAEFVQWTGLIVLASTVHAHLVEIGESVG